MMGIQGIGENREMPPRMMVLRPQFHVFAYVLHEWALGWTAFSFTFGVDKGWLAEPLYCLIDAL